MIFAVSKGSSGNVYLGKASLESLPTFVFIETPSFCLQTLKGPYSKMEIFKKSSEGKEVVNPCTGIVYKTISVGHIQLNPPIEGRTLLSQNVRKEYKDPSDWMEIVAAMVNELVPALIMEGQRIETIVTGKIISEHPIDLQALGFTVVNKQGELEWYERSACCKRASKPPVQNPARSALLASLEDAHPDSASEIKAPSGTK